MIIEQMEEISFGVVLILFSILYLLHLITAHVTEWYRPPTPPPPDFFRTHTGIKFRV